MKKKKIFILILILLITGIGFVFSYEQFTLQYNIPKSWKLYNDTTNKLSFRYPPDWKITRKVSDIPTEPSTIYI